MAAGYNRCLEQMISSNDFRPPLPNILNLPCNPPSSTISSVASFSISFLPSNPTNAPAPTQQETSKKRTRRTVKQQRGIVGLSYEVIKDRRSQRPEAREAARKEAIAKGKEKKATAESKKKAEKAKSAAGAARGQPGRIQSKMGSKGVPNKASGKTR